MDLLKNARGFSLMELMTVVAIVAILYTIAVPSYRTYQARARQKEGFGLLNEYYLAAHAARAEWGIFPGNFKASGFQPKGDIIYRLRADDNPNDIEIRQDDPVCFRTQAPCDCASAATPCPTFKTWNEVARNTTLGPLGVAGVIPSPCGDAATTDNTIRAQVAGWISGSAANPDKYMINERKQITMCQDGVQ